VRVLVIAFVLAMSALSIGSPPAAASVLVPFDDIYGSIVVRVVIDGKGPYNFAVDTGSLEMVVSPDLADELRLAATGKRSESGAGPAEMSDVLTRLSSVAIGGLIVRDLPADEVVLPDGLAHRVPGLTIRGLIGFDFLRRYIATIDYSNLTLTFDRATDFVPPPRAMVLPMLMVAGGRAPGIPVAVDGNAAVFMVDTGNSGWPDVKAAFASGTRLSERAGTRGTAQAAGGNESLHVVCLHSFAVSDWSRTHVPAYIDVADYGVSRWSDNGGSIGYETLRAFRTSFDFTRKLVFLDPVPYEPHVDYATTAQCLPRK
jgi:predicted aspartyl protease